MGSIRVKKQVAPSTPVAGYVELYVDVADGIFKVKDEAGTVTNAQSGVNAIDTKANLDALPREEGKIYYASDENKLYSDNGASLDAVGEDGGGVTAFDTFANISAMPRVEGNIYYTTDTKVVYTDDGTLLKQVGDFLANGIFPMTGDLKMGSNNIQDATTVKGPINVDVIFGSKEAGSGVSGRATFKSGDTGGAGLASGQAHYGSGDATGANPTGDVFVGSGDTATGPSGDVVLDIGSSTNKGKIRIKGGSEGTIGQVLKSADAQGAVEWADDTTGIDGQDTTANLLLLPRAAGKLYYSTDEEILLLDNGTTLLDAGSGAGGSAIERTQAAHGFAQLDAIYHNGVSFVKAQADDELTLAQFIVTAVEGANVFKASKFGEVSAPAHGLTVGGNYFLSDSVAGAITETEPNTFSCPMLYVEDANTVLLQVYRPAGVAGSIPNAIIKTQAAHGFALLDAIYYDGASWIKAQANSPSTLAEFIVTKLNGVNSFTAQKFGEVVIAGHGLTPGSHYFLSNTVAGSYTSSEPSPFSCPLFFVEDANILHAEVYRPAQTSTGGSAGGLYDRTISAVDDADLNAAVAAATDGDSVGVATEVLPVVSALQTVSKRLGIYGAGNGSEINGAITFATGSDNSALKDLRVNGSIVIDAGVKNLIIKDIWLTIGNTITDNSGNSSNLILAVVEE